MGFFRNFGLNEALGAGASLMNFFQQGKTIEAQKQMQREQNAWNEKMWNLNNEWNRQGCQTAQYMTFSYDKPRHQC